MVYVGTHYNSYYNTLYGDTKTSVYGRGTRQSNQLAAAQTNKYNSDLFGTQALTNTTNLKKGAEGLQTALRSLIGGDAFKQKAAVSANSDLLAVKSDQKKSSQADLAVKIDQVAGGQINEGTDLARKAEAGLEGYQQFAIETGGKTYQFSFQAAAGDTNEDVQRKMAAAINQRGIGIQATVEVDSAAGSSALKLSAEATGEQAKAQFSISDISGSAVAKTGADSQVQAAQNAIYRVNDGPAQTSQSNDVDLGNGLTVTLKEASDEAVQITYGADTETSLGKISDLVDSYNQLYGAALNSDDSKTEFLFQQLIGLNKAYASQLSGLGIGFDANGYMTVDADALKQAAADGRLESFFTENGGGSYGYANQLSNIASSVSNNTNLYVSEDSLSNVLDSAVASKSADSKGLGADFSRNVAASMQTYMMSNIFGLTFSNGSSSSGWLFDFKL